MNATSLTTSRPAVLVACGLLLSTFAAQAYPYDAGATTLPLSVNLTGTDSRSSGVVQTYNIPISSWPDLIQIQLKGGDGGNAKATGVVSGSDSADGGSGAKVVAKFRVDPSSFSALLPGGQLRVVIGNRGKSTQRDNDAAAGGGGATALLYLAPTDGAEWIELAVAGGGGGALASHDGTDNFSHNGYDALTTTSGGDGAGYAGSGGENGEAGAGLIGAAGGGGSYKSKGGGTNEDPNDDAPGGQPGRTGVNFSGEEYMGGVGGMASGGGASGGYGYGAGGGGYCKDIDDPAAAGGGGGYSGGGSGQGDGQGGGGGSYVLSTYAESSSITQTASNETAGYALITYNPTPGNTLDGASITLAGSNPTTILDYQTYSDPGATAQDVYGNDVTVSVSQNTVQNGQPGTYSVTYSAEDQFGNTATATRTVQIVSAHKPTFTVTGNVSVKEDSGSFSQAGFIDDFNANDSGQSLSSYQVTNDNNSLFATQPAIANNGTLTFTPAANAVGTAVVTVVAVDNPDDPTNGASDPVTFYLDVVGIDDPPTNITFTPGALAENQTFAGTVSAVEPFGGDVSYLVTGGADELLFTIGETSGVLSFLTAPDFENPSDADQDGIYEVQVLATGSDGSSSATFTFSINDVNEAPSAPTLSSSTPLENTTLVGTVSSIDPESDSLTYAIVGGADQALFQIDANTGTLSFLAAPDYENPADSDGDNIYQVEVSASDGVAATSTFAIAVQDDTSPPTDITVSVSEIPEGQTAVGVVTATDPFGGEVTFAFGGGRDSSLFNFTSQGVLSFKNPPNFENPKDFDDNNIFVLNIQATGSEGSVKVVRYLTVTDVNEAPSISGLESTSIAENTALVGALTLSDPENQALTVTLTGGADQALFTLSGATLSFVSAPDFEAPADADHDGVYEIEVTANDGTNDSQPATFSITVTDATENDLSEFRSTHGLASDGSNDNADWSGNGVANILYLAFGLGDPNEPDIDRTRLPSMTVEGDTLRFNYIRPLSSNSGLSVMVMTSDDASQWVSPLSLGTEFSPTSFEAVQIDETDYQRVTETYNIQPGETSRFYRLAVEEFSPL